MKVQHLAVDIVRASVRWLAVIAEERRNGATDIALHTRRRASPRIPRCAAGKPKNKDGAEEDMARIHCGAWKSPNDPKLSDRGARRGTCTVGGKAAAEAGAVTCGAVRCSAWLGAGWIWNLTHDVI